MMRSNGKTHLQQSSFQNLFIREPSTSRTVSMAAGQIIPLHKKPENNSLECGLSQEPSNLWIKRLRSHPSDSLPSSSKRFKTSENEYKAQARNLLGIISNIDSCNHYLSKCLEGRQELKSTPLLPKDGECAYEESKAMNNWIHRWCRGSRQAAPLRKVAPALCEPERSSVMAAPLRKVAPVLCELEKSSVMAAPLRKVAAPVLCEPERSNVMAALCEPERSNVMSAPLRKVAAPVLCEPERSNVTAALCEPKRSNEMSAPLRKVAPVLCEPERSSGMVAPLRKVKVAPVLCEPERSSGMVAPLRKVKVAPVLCEPERSRVMRKASGGKRLPSIAAMALMGAAMKSAKTCRYKKKGSLLLWNI